MRDFDPEVVVIAGGEVAISATVEQQIGELLPGTSRSSGYLVDVANNTRVGGLSIEVTGGDDPTALGGSGIENVEVDDVTMRVSGGADTNNGVRILGGQAVMRNITVIVDGDPSTSVIGVFGGSSAGTDLRVEGADIRTTGDGGSYGHRGVWSVDGQVTVMDSTVVATGASAVGLHSSHDGSVTFLGGMVEATNVAASASSTMRVQDAILDSDGTSVATGSTEFSLSGVTLLGSVGGSATCAGVYDADNTFHADSCP